MIKSRKSYIDAVCAPERTSSDHKFTCFKQSELKQIAKNVGVSNISGNKHELYNAILIKLGLPNSASDLDILKYVKDTNLSSEKKRQEIFKPEQPGPLISNFDIDAVLQQYQKAYPSFHSYGGVPYDFLSNTCGANTCSHLKKLDICRFKDGTSAGIVINLDVYGNEGTHWVTLFISREKDQIIAEYFDSLGPQTPRRGVESQSVNPRSSAITYHIPLNIYNYVQQLGEQSSNCGLDFVFKFNQRKHQNENKECGMYCLYYIIQRIKGHKYHDNGKRLSDDLMARLRNVIFLSPKFCWKCNSVRN